MKKNAILTFDYELFLGKKTGTVENCVIKPTQHILAILQKNLGKAIFFVDATWLMFLKKNSLKDLKLVSDQLKRIIKIDSSVELHLHPQWIDAYQYDNHVRFASIKNYKLQSLSQEEINNIFKESIELIESITHERIKCFRAGGYCIEPFNLIKPAFDLFNIKYDFSVVPGVYLKSGNNYDFDFNSATIFHSYSFQNEVMESDIQGQFIEVPLSTFNNNPILRILNLTSLILTKDRIFGDGIGIQSDLSFVSRLRSKSIGFSKSPLTIDHTSNVVFKHLIRNYFKKTPLLVISSHPKTISKQALLNLSFITHMYNTHNTKDLSNILSLE